MNPAIASEAVVRPEPPSPASSIPSLVFRRLLAPTDFSEPSLKALDYALSLASPDGATVRMMHVLAPTPSFLNFESLSVLLPNEAAAAQCRAELERIAHELRHHDALDGPLRRSSRPPEISAPICWSSRPTDAPA